MFIRVIGRASKEGYYAVFTDESRRWEATHTGILENYKKMKGLRKVFF